VVLWNQASVGLKDEKLIKMQTFILPNIITMDPYNFELYRFKVGAFFETQCIYYTYVFIFFAFYHFITVYCFYNYYYLFTMGILILVSVSSVETYAHRNSAIAVTGYPCYDNGLSINQSIDRSIID